MKDLVSVIVPVYNDAERLRKCLACLSAQTYSPLEVIVVDNGSDDLAAVERLVAQCSRAKMVGEALPGSYAARNRGIAEARGEILAFTDADCEPVADWVEQGMKALRSHSNCGLVGGAIQIVADDLNHPVELYESVMALNQEKFVTQDHYGATANVFTYSDVVRRVGVFNADMKSSGDVEWGQRVFAAGYAQLYAPRALVFHPARSSFAQLARQASRHAGGFYDLHCRQADSGLKGNLVFLKLLGFHLMPPVMFAWKVLFDPELKRLAQKIKVVMTLAFVRWVTVGTLVVLRLGGEAERE